MTSLRHSLNLSRGGVISLVGAGGKTALMFRLARELTGQGDRVLTTTTTKIRVPLQRQSPVVMVSDSVESLLQQASVILQRSAHVTAGLRIVHFQNKLKGFDPNTIDRIWQSGIFRWIIVEADGAAGKPIKAPAFHEPVIPQCTQWLVAVIGLEAVGKPLNEKWAFRPQLVSKITGLNQGASISESAIAKLFVDTNGIMRGFSAQTKRFAFLNQADSPERLAAGQRIAKMIKSQKTVNFAGVLIGQTLCEPIVKQYYPAN